jgi:hypothetical protein
MGMRLETELLLCCTRTCMDDTSAEKIGTLLQEDLDWEYLIRTAIRHEVMPLLYRSLHSTYPKAVPKVILDRLRDHFRVNTERNLILTGTLLKLLRLFEAHGIPAMPYKGPVLAASVYGSLALRQFTDLDILVHREDVLKAKELLLSQQYQLTIHLTSAQEATYLQSKHAYAFVHYDDGVVVDLHWAFAWRHWSFPLHLEHLWQRSKPASLNGTTVRNFPPEDLLVILCLHGAKDGWRRLQIICDIAEAIYVYQAIDWGRVMEQARVLGSQRVLFLGLSLARDLLGTSLPEAVVHRIQADPVVQSLASKVCGWLFSEVDTLPGTIDVPDFYLIRMRERLRDRVSYFLYYLRRFLRPGMMIPNARDRALLPLPAWLAFLYYALRPIRLIGDHGQRLPKRLLRLLWYCLRGR